MAAIDETTTEAPASRASLVPTGLIFGAFLILAIVFAVSAGSWYAAFMTVHVLFVVIWIGGGALLTLFGIMAERNQDSGQVAQIAKMAAFAGERIFAPSALIVVAMGIAMVLNAHLGFDHFWIAFGLVGFLATFLTRRRRPQPDGEEAGRDDHRERPGRAGDPGRDHRRSS